MSIKFMAQDPHVPIKPPAPASVSPSAPPPPVPPPPPAPIKPLSSRIAGTGPATRALVAAAAKLGSPTALSAVKAKLASTSSSLNKVTDELNRLVTSLEGSLKKFSLGVEVWVIVNEDKPNEDGFYLVEKLGYAKWGTRWLILLKKTDGALGEEPEVRVWPFSDAPRELRMRSVEHIPSLLNGLAERAADMVSSLTTQVKEVADIASVLAQEDGEVE